MATNHQFSIAAHIMCCLVVLEKKEICSSTLASSVNTNPSFVRRILSKLSKANLIETSAGKGGHCVLAKDPKKISLYDIYKAVEAPPTFSVHAYAIQKACPVSRNIKPVMESAQKKSQKAVEQTLKSITLVDLSEQIKRE